jgi:hypothetical protein
MQGLNLIDYKTHYIAQGTFTGQVSAVTYKGKYHLTGFFSISFPASTQVW